MHQFQIQDGLSPRHQWPKSTGTDPSGNTIISPCPIPGFGSSPPLSFQRAARPVFYPCVPITSFLAKVTAYISPENGRKNRHTS